MTATAEVTQHELNTEDGVLRYHEVGSGPPLLMLHGSGPGVTGMRNFRNNLAAFSPHFRCLVLDFPGFGVSDPTGEHPLIAAPKAVVRFLDGLGLRNVDVIGNSMGGHVAVNLAIDRQDLFRRIVTIGGVGAGLLSTVPAEGIKLLNRFTDNPTKESLVAWLSSMVFDPALVTDELIEERWQQATEPKTLESARKMYSKEALAGLFAAQTGRAPYWAHLDRISAPTLITWGRDDRVTPLDMVLLPLRMIPNAEVHILPNCGHWAMIEQKDAWESAVLAFLTR